jgi:hypothetical protein
MLSVIKELVLVIVSLTTLAYGSSYALKTAYKKVRSLALGKISKGLTPMSSITRHLTCKKFDKKMKYVRHYEGSCRRRK